MGKRCCVHKCVKRKEDQISVYRFPPSDNPERERWIQAIPLSSRKGDITDESVVCSRHWPVGTPMISVFGKERPSCPPSIFGEKENKLPPLRTTVKSCAEARRPPPQSFADQQAVLKEKDSFTFQSLQTSLIEEKKPLPLPTTVFTVAGVLFIQSLEFICGIPNFLIKIFPSLKFETFHGGVKCFVSSLSANRMTKLDRWSRLHEAIRYLKFKENSRHQNVIHEQAKIMQPRIVGETLYPQGLLVRAFEYFCTARCLYKRLREDFKLPSIQTLTRITSRVSKLTEGTFLSRVFRNVTEMQKLCIILHDEIYVKKMLLYHGGTVFGRSVNDAAKKATTVLGIMISCLYGGPSFISKMLPISSLKVTFLRSQIDQTRECIAAAGGEVTCIISDGNRTNQAFIKSYDTVPGKPWLTLDNTYLIYDFVHLFKNIRNNWLTEKTGELRFTWDGVTRVAKWSHLRELYKLELNGIAKISSLREISIAPKPVERQKVQPVLDIFCERTRRGLLSHPGMEEVEGKEDTAFFLQLVIKFWTIMNVKSEGADIKHMNPLEEVFRNPDDERLDFLQKFGTMAKDMAGPQGKRVKQLTNDTGKAIHHTCFGIVDLVRYLLTVKLFNYVPLGKFTTDILEKFFGKLRQGSGGSYFITVQQIIEKVNIIRASLLLSLEDISDLKGLEGHKCDSCGFLLDEEGVYVFDSLCELESSITLDTKMSLVYIAGYVTRNDEVLDENDLLDETMFYTDKYGEVLKELDRGGLKFPTDTARQWTFFCFSMFQSVKNKVCKKSLADIFMLIAEHHDMKSIRRCHAIILSNIFINNFCKVENPKSTKESSVKVLKLSPKD